MQNQNPDRMIGTLLSWKDYSTGEHADVAIKIEDVTLHCEARFYFHPHLKIGKDFCFNLLFDVWWNESSIGLQKTMLENSHLHYDESGDIYHIAGKITQLDSTEKEMIIDCQCGFLVRMEHVNNLSCGDWIQASGSFLITFDQ